MSKKVHARAIRTLEFVAEHGIGIGMPYVRFFQKEKIGEVRFKGKDNLYRVLFFHWEENGFILTHGFVKKDQKTPKMEIIRAIRYRDDYLKGKGDYH
jgi:phage-related protein